MINFPFGTNGKLIILGVPILKHIIVSTLYHLHQSSNTLVSVKYFALNLHFLENMTTLGSFGCLLGAMNKDGLIFIFKIMAYLEL